MGFNHPESNELPVEEVHLDSQQVELLGRNRINAAPIEAGFEAATPERGNGIDLITYRWALTGEFIARLVQRKAAATPFTLWLRRVRHPVTPLLLVLMCAAGRETPNGTQAAPGVAPASAKWEGPLMPGPGGGQVRTTIYYGPWQCTQRWMAHCQTKCTSEGRKLMGCMWLADIKTDWQGRYLGPTLAAGGRYAITHCCCDYPLVKDTVLRRQQWKGARDSFRKEWGKEFGEWPKSGDEHWPGHHIRDLQRGGDATAKRNVLPAPPGVHSVFTDEYPMCYAGGSRWSTVGPDRPYSD